MIDVFQRIGFALWQVQILEDALAKYFVVVHQLKVGEALAQAEAAFEKVEKTTMGQLVERIRQREGAGSSLLTRLESFVDERNWLVHRSRHQNRTDLYDLGRVKSLVARIETVADDALSIAHEVERSLSS